MRRCGRAALLAMSALALAPGAAFADMERTGRLLVTYAPSEGTRAHASAATGVAARAGGRIAVPPVDEIGLAVVKPAPGESMGQLAARLKDDPAVKAVRPERRYQLRIAPNDTAFRLQLPGAPVGTNEQWWASGEDLFTSWDVTSGAGARIAILDTGIDATHPEFAGRIAHAVDYDDLQGHGGARTDEVGHGTHVASLACAVPNNQYGIAGSGFNCNLLVAKTDLSEGSVAASIVWAVRMKADAINMSFGTDSGAAPSAEIKRAIRYAARRDAVMVAAAADEPRTEQGDPANLLQPTGTGRSLNSKKALGITVTAATIDNHRAAFAGRGSQISLASYGAYGSGVTSPGLLGAFPANTTELETGSFVPPSPPCSCRVVVDGDARFARIAGTSMAAPLVAGVAGAMRNLNSDLSGAEIAKILKKTANRPGSRWNSDTGWGVMNAGRAMRSARNADRRAPRSRIKSAKGNGTVTLTWTGTDNGPAGVRVSGIKYYDIYRVTAGGGAVRVKRVKGTSVSVTGAPGDRFYTVAVDKAGNKEKPPKRGDALVKG